MMSSTTAEHKSKNYVVAILYVLDFLYNNMHDSTHISMTSLNIPANNCAILQKGDDLQLLSAGQHYITNPNVTIRGMYTLGENQKEMPTKDMYVQSLIAFYNFDTRTNISGIQIHQGSSTR